MLTELLKNGNRTVEKLNKVANFSVYLYTNGCNKISHRTVFLPYFLRTIIVVKIKNHNKNCCK